MKSQRPLKIILMGYGKMGRAIERIAMEAGHQIVLRIDNSTQWPGNEEIIQSADVAIEFSRPEAAFQNVVNGISAGLPVVCGTTGWAERLPEARQYCAEKKGAFFYASNFSIGVYIFMETNRRLAQLMGSRPQYKVGIEETHHIHKLDAPSGTAVTLAETVLPYLEHKNGWALENDLTLPSDTLPIRSIRSGEVPGTHIITYRSAIDTIVLSHEAHSREGFAAGAVEAAQWIVGKQGCFSMEDMMRGTEI
jgi:4-hydroxy-tetrahydrodipicolinate reductase